MALKWRSSPESEVRLIFQRAQNELRIQEGDAQVHVSSAVYEFELRLASR